MAELLAALSHPSGRLFLQLIVILLASRVCFLLLKRLGQPAVVGEVLAGIVLGPTVLGLFFPQFSAFLFPVDSLRPLELLSELGIVLFLFLVGMEMDLDQVGGRLGQSLAVSLGGVALSFALGAGVAWYLHPLYGGSGPALPFVLFLGTAMSITAFPVLARIIRERHLSAAPSGSVSLAAAAVGDVLAWCMLAVVVALGRSGSPWSALLVSAGAILFVLFMLLILRPLFERMGSFYITREVIGRGVVTITLLILLASALLSHVIGIHALFGAFIAGTVVPRDSRFRAILSERIEDFTAVLLLPIFFALTGLRTDLSVIVRPENWVALGLILGVAVVGKVAGSALPARLSGMSWRDASIVGMLMNTRGLVEIIILNIGLQLGILPLPVFAMMVVMALVTTFMTGPALGLLGVSSASRTAMGSGSAGAVLVPFGPPESGRTLVNVAAIMAERVVALHVSPISESGLTGKEPTHEEVFGSLVADAALSDVSLEPIHRLSPDLIGTINLEAKHCDAPLVLIGAARALFAVNALGGKVEDLLRDVSGMVGVFVDRGMATKPSVAIVWDGPVDDFVLAFWNSESVTRRAHMRSETRILDVSDRVRASAARPAEMLSGSAARAALTDLAAADLCLVSAVTYRNRPEMFTSFSLLILRQG